MAKNGSSASSLHKVQSYLQFTTSGVDYLWLQRTNRLIVSNRCISPLS